MATMMDSDYVDVVQPVVAAGTGYDPQATARPERPKKLSDAIVEAIRSEFRSLLEGDLDDNLAQIEQLAATTRGLFQTLKGGVPPIRGGRFPAPGGAGYSTGAWFGPQPSLPNVEQFGAAAVRQIVSNIPDVAAKVADAIANNPVRQVEAIAEARSKGMAALADKLEQRLLSRATPAEPVVAAAPIEPQQPENAPSYANGLLGSKRFTQAQGEI